MSKISILKRQAKLKHLSDFSIEELISSFGMYESAIIDLRTVNIVENPSEGNCFVEVSGDVKALNQFLFSDDAIMLPCPDCGREQAFSSISWDNPRNRRYQKTDDKSVVGMKRMMPLPKGEFPKRKRNIFELPFPCFEMNNYSLCDLNENDLEILKDDDKKDEFLYGCITECKYQLLEIAKEIRKDYYCGFQNYHTVFVNFRLFDPIEPDYYGEYSELLNINNEDAESKQIIEAYDYLQDCLIIQKVGQYPSLADMQMFDVEKYRKVLGKESYGDLTRAIGLNADGIGCGAFVYLRRILERLVEEAHKNSDVDEEEYKQARFDEKIKMLENVGKTIIPDTLKDVKTKIYGTLSKGVHENGDDECMELFPYMQFCIEQILDERIRQKELEEKVKKLNLKLNK